MLKNIVIILFLLTLISLNAAEVKLEHSEISALYKIEKHGMQDYRADRFEQAFEKLSQTAPLGFKQSQYYLAFLYLKGQHVKKSMLEGMAWLGVAKESGHTEMLTLYDSLYGSFNPAQKEAVDKKVAEYIALYGIKNQNVSCEKRKKVGSKRPVLECVKMPIKVEYQRDPGQSTM